MTHSANTRRFLKAGTQALEHARKHSGGSARVPSISPDEIKSIRGKLDLTQKAFCEMYGFDLDSLRSWETARRIPDHGNELLLRLIAAEPSTMRELVRRVELDASKRILEDA